MSLSPERWRAVVRGTARDPAAFLLRRGLWLAWLPYAVGVWWRNRRFDKGRNVHRAGIPVISVGNLTVGGTGKTPCVEYVARLLRERDLRVAVLSRGYGAELGRNDEAMVLEENLPDVPHYQGRDRVALARTAVEESESEVMVLDDGFQHRRLARDLDIVLIDATDPWASGYLLPRGGLREPRTGLRRAGFVVLTRCDAVSEDAVGRIVSEVRRIVPAVPIGKTIHAPLELTSGERQEPVDALKGRPIGAFCGIGNPNAFRQTLTALGTNVRDFREYPDHHAYRREDVDDLRRWAATLPDDAVVATTQKDWVKLRLTELAGRPLWAVRVGLRFIEGRDLFDKAVLKASGLEQN
ncbi:MAG: tetraacyldisaccharide 4'-kinase [Zavarzinella sp.]|nr:tetraacyldisaccharide 4'-kinase [Zavarzinella sp.]